MSLSESQSRPSNIHRPVPVIEVPGQLHIEEITPAVDALSADSGHGICAYRLHTRQGAIWIDCPSQFESGLTPVDAIFFSQRDFTGAAADYHRHWGSRLYMNRHDASYHKELPFEETPRGNFSLGELQAFHIGGHTPGFTVYRFHKLLFVCDLLFSLDTSFTLNSLGRRDAMHAAARRLLRQIRHQDIQLVCGYNYAIDFKHWQNALTRCLAGQH